MQYLSNVPMANISGKSQNWQEGTCNGRKKRWRLALEDVLQPEPSSIAKTIIMTMLSLIPPDFRSSQKIEATDGIWISARKRKKQI
jgi:hypothetical protein